MIKSETRLKGEKLTTRQEASLILKLSLPAILAQISSIIMQYIDASMVGHLGANASAAIGLVSSTTWLVGGIITAAAMGFSVCVAHRIGAKDDEGARVIVKWGLNCTFVFSILVMIICVLISSKLPVWMGGDEAIRKDASAYILIVKSPSLHLIGRKEKSSFSQFAANELTMALKIAIPVAIDNIIMGFAYVAFTRIVSPFGTVSVAANSFSITAESLCYMPGFGIGVAATTIVGQCIGARRKDLGKRLGWFSNKLLENYFNIHF